MFTGFVTFRIDRCGTTIKDQDCADDKAIDDFIYGLQVDSWAIFSKVDFSKYGQTPVYRVMEVFARTLMERNHNKIQFNMQLAKHTYYTEDSIFDIGIVSSLNGEWY